MRYCVSDLHGEYGLFTALLERIGFSEGDTLYVCGDIIDKGPESVRLAKYISSLPNVRCIIGNHELLFLNYYHSLLEDSPDDFDEVLGKLKNYFKGDGHLLDWELVDWLESLPPYIEEDEFICVHAGLPLDGVGYPLPLHTATYEELVYDRRFKDRDVVNRGPKCVFFGHTETSNIIGENKIIAYPRSQSNITCVSDFHKVHLDTGTWSSGTLGCFIIDKPGVVYVKKVN